MPQSPATNTFTMGDDTPRAIVAALRHWQPELSWSRARRLMRSRRVSVGGTLCLDEGRQLSIGERVAIHSHPLPPPPRQDAVTVHYCDRDLVIVEKPARMVTLRHYKERKWPQRRKAMQPALEEVIPDLIYSPDRRKRPPLFSVHRIDRDTSGLLVFARSTAIQEKLIAQFKHHDVQRVYRAVVPGTLAQQTIRTKLIRDRGDGLRGSTTLDEGTIAVTHVHPIRQILRARDHAVFSEVECRLETGRTHQIRIHLAEGGNPVCGDTMYRGPHGVAPSKDDSGAPRLALHAAQLGLTHPSTGEAIFTETPWPEDIQRFIARLGHAGDDR